jgi:hypothetical protein
MFLAPASITGGLLFRASRPQLAKALTRFLVTPFLGMTLNNVIPTEVEGSQKSIACLKVRFTNFFHFYCQI